MQKPSLFTNSFRCPKNLIDLRQLYCRRNAKLLIIFKQLLVERDSYWLETCLLHAKMQSCQLFSKTGFGGQRILLVESRFNFRANCKSYHYLQTGLPDKAGLPITGVLLQVGLDVGALGIRALSASARAAD